MPASGADRDISRKFIFSGKNTPLGKCHPGNSSGMPPQDPFAQRKSRPGDAFFPLLERETYPPGPEKNDTSTWPSYGFSKPYIPLETLRLSKSEQGKVILDLIRPGISKQEAAKLWSKLDESEKNYKFSRYYSVPGEKNDEPAASQDKITESRRASEIPGIQKDIHQRLGINGKGVIVGVLDDNCHEGRSLQPTGVHSKVVTASVSDSDEGVAPGATVYNYSAVNTVKTPPLEDNKADLDRYVLQAPAGTIISATESFRNILKEPKEQRPAVINHSMGLNMDIMTLKLFNKLESKDPVTEEYLYPKLRKTVRGTEAEYLKMTDEERFQKYSGYIRERIKKDKEDKGPFYQAREAFNDVTKQLWDEGIPVVIAAGNSRDKVIKRDTSRLNSPESEEFDLYSANNEHVITVGSVNTANTPGNRRDDKPSEFSSRGPVTLAAPGENVIYRDKDTGKTHVTEGTSFSAPYVTGTIALMKQANPNLTSDQVRDILTGTSVMPEGALPQEVGAGVVDPQAAVKAAMALAGK